MRLLAMLAAMTLLVVLLAGCSGIGGKSEDRASAPQGTTAEETTAQKTTTASTAAAKLSLTPWSKDDAGRFDATTTVTRVVDGDTVDITPAVEGNDRVRFIGVDTPEARDPDCGKQPYADEAKAFTTTELEGEEVELEFDVERTDRYGRLLAYVYPRDEQMFNEKLLREGYAQMATFPPNVKYVDRLLAAQEEARAEGSGLWGLSAEELAAQTDRGNGIGGGGCVQQAQPKSPPPQPQPQPQPQPRPQPQPQPAPPPQPVPQPPPRPQPPPTPAPAVPARGDVDCSDFGSSAEAMPYLLPGDPHRLDRDKDGIPCE